MPENRGLTTQQLREKASHSRWARQALNRDKWKDKYQEISTDKSELDPREIERRLKDYSEVESNCDLCHHPSHHITPMYYKGNESWICINCYFLIYPNRNGCFLPDEAPRPSVAFLKEEEELNRLFEADANPEDPKYRKSGGVEDVLNILSKGRSAPQNKVSPDETNDLGQSDSEHVITTHSKPS
jgi:hypothetical protein